MILRSKRRFLQDQQSVADPGILSRGGGGLNKFSYGDLGVVAPWSGFPLKLQMSETRILIRLLRMFFLRNWEFGSVLSKVRNFWGI
jgi:hypothetical protein